MSNSEEVLLCKLNTEAMVEEDDELPPPVVTRTRSGRQVRTPVAFQDSQVHSIQKTPSRRTRKPVNQSENTEVPTIAALLPCNVHAYETSGPESAPVLLIDLEDTPNPVVDIPLEDVTVSKMDFAISKSDHEESRNRHTVIETPPKQSMIYRKMTHSEATEKQNPVIPLGKPKSGRVWKDRNKQRFSALLRDKPLCTSWEKKMEAKRDKELVKKYSLQLKEDKAKAKEEKRKRREETLKRRADNERKAEVVQVIRNPTKIKRMKKKQLRKIEKRDTLALLQKSQLKPQKATGKVIEN